MSTDRSVATTRPWPRSSFWIRFLAALIDGLLLGIVNGLVGRGEPDAGTYFIGLAISLAYFTYFEGSRSGQTIGKRASGIRVVDINGGGPIGHNRAVVRWLARFLSTIVFFLGYLWMLWDPEKQTWHDKLAGSVVVANADFPAERWPG
jgi:uncharacterized RDD family membrane protein YckC